MGWGDYGKIREPTMVPICSLEDPLSASRVA